MNHEEQLQKIEEVRKKTLDVVANLDAKLARGEIDGIQHQIMLHDKLLGKTKEEIISYLDSEKKKIFARIDREENERIQENISRHKKTAVLTITAMLLMACVGLLFLTEDGITGFVIGNFASEEQVQISTTESFEQMLNHTNITSFKISGTIDKGSAIVKLRLENGNELVVGEIIATETGETYTLTTDKKNYLLGEQVNITINPNSDEVSTYVYFNEESTIVNDGTFLPLALGEYKIVTIITDAENIARLELNFTVTENPTDETQEIISATLGKENIFTEICQETCEFTATSNPTIIVQPSNSATITINEIIVTTQKENNAPTQIKALEDIELTVGEGIQIDLDEYFTDTDNEQVFYDITENEHIISNIENNILTITAQIAGQQTTHIYATDSNEITTSNAFEIRINPTVRIEIENTTNETNLTEIDTNNTLNITINSTEINNTLNETNTTETNNTNTIIETIDECNLPINERPANCFEGNESKYFKDIIATLENKDGVTVGRFNRIGNFIIKGLLVENANDAGEERDFKIIYRQVNDLEETITTTAWIDSESGNLYLKGKLYEENSGMEAPQFNTYIIKNKAGIVLAYFDETTGDLYLRGNLVQLGKVIQ